MRPHRSLPRGMVLALNIFAEGEQSENGSSICYLVNWHAPVPSPTTTRTQETCVACVALPKV